MSVLGNHLLNCAGFHAADRGFGIATLNENHYTWVLSRLAVESVSYTHLNILGELSKGGLLKTDVKRVDGLTLAEAVEKYNICKKEVDTEAKRIYSYRHSLEKIHCSPIPR